MTISSVETLGQLASTVVATYGTLTLGRDDVLKASLTSGNANFVSTQADAFVEQYRLVDQLPRQPDRFVEKVLSAKA